MLSNSPVMDIRVFHRLIEELTQGPGSRTHGILPSRSLPAVITLT
jgi:hypothetical protein